MTTAEIIASGSELTSGDRLNTNAQWLSQQLRGLGITTLWHTTLGDRMADNLAALEIARDRVDLIIMTGGLGPTQDDLTREAFAKLSGKSLIFDRQLLESIEKVFTVRGVPMPERNQVQAFIPAGALAIANPVGTAPGIWMEMGDKTLIALPGVPREMQHMWHASVLPRLKEKFGRMEHIVTRKINLFGLGESAVEAKVLDLTARDHTPEVGITASEAVISLRITARHQELTEAQNQVDKTASDIYARLAGCIFSEGDDSPAQCLCKKLEARGLSLAIGEIATDGLFSHKMMREAAPQTRLLLRLYQSPAQWTQDFPGIAPLGVAESAAALRECLGTDLCTVISSESLGNTPLRLLIGIATAGASISQTYQTQAPLREALSRAATFAICQTLKILDSQPFRC